MLTPAPGEAHPRRQYRLRADLLQSSSAEKSLQALVDNKLTVNQQHILMANKANSFLSYVRKSVEGAG